MDSGICFEPCIVCDAVAKSQNHRPHFKFSTLAEIEQFLPLTAPTWFYLVQSFVFTPREDQLGQYSSCWKGWESRDPGVSKISNSQRISMDFRRKTNIAYLIICQRSSKETRQQTSDRLWFGKNLRKIRIKNNQNTKNDLNVTWACWNDRNDSYDTNLRQQSSRSASFTTVLQAAAGHRHHSPRQWAPNQGLPSSDSSTEATLVTCILPDFCVQQTLSSFIFVLKSFQGHENNRLMHVCLHWSITCIIKALVPTRAAALNFKANFIAFIVLSVTANLLIQCMVGGELLD